MIMWFWSLHKKLKSSLNNGPRTTAEIRQGQVGAECIITQWTWAGIKTRWVSSFLTHPLKYWTYWLAETCKRAVLGLIWCSLRAVRLLWILLNMWIPRDNKSLASLQRLLMQCKSASHPSRIHRAPRCIPKMFDIQAFISSFSCFATATSVANRLDMSTAMDSRKRMLLYTDSPCVTRQCAWVIVASSAVTNASKIACSAWLAQLIVRSLNNKPECRLTCNLVKTESFSSNILNNLWGHKYIKLYWLTRQPQSWQGRGEP